MNSIKVETVKPIARLRDKQILESYQNFTVRFTRLMLVGILVVGSCVQKNFFGFIDFLKAARLGFDDVL